MKGFIYKITNLINGKIYIGQTKVDVQVRWKEHIRKSKYNDQIIQRAISKYGKENFTIETLEVCNIEEIDEREIFYIKFFDSTNKSKGYNVSIGGKTPRFERDTFNIDILIKLYVEELIPIHKIAKLYNSTPYIIGSELKNAGVKIRTRWESSNKVIKISKETIVEALERTGSIRKAAKYSNIKYSTFRNACILHNVEYNLPRARGTV